MKDCMLYVGLDAHKKEHKAAMFLGDSDTPVECTVPNESRAMERWVRRMQRLGCAQILVAYEAGVCGFGLQRQLQREGLRCMVVAPSLIPVRPGQRVQTDRRDAAGLGRLLRAGMLTEVHPPDAAQEAVRDLCRCREAAMLDLGRIRQQVLKFLLRRGLFYGQGSNWTQRHWAWLKAVRLEGDWEGQVYAEYLGELEHRQERLERLEARVREAAMQQPYRQQVGWLRCLQGIETVTAMTILAELYSFERFGSARELMSYLGLTPSESSSGQSRCLGGITKAGNRRVRRVLIEAAWHQRQRPTASRALRARRKGQPAWVIRIAQQAQQRLHRRYWRLLGKGKPANKAVTAVARELAGFVWSLLRAGGPPDRPVGPAPEAESRSTALAIRHAEAVPAARPTGGIPPPGGSDRYRVQRADRGHK